MPQHVLPTPTDQEIATAKANGWQVIDLNNNVAGITARTHWVLVNPQGFTVHRGWDEIDAWRGILKPSPSLLAYERIQTERRRQDAKWGQQNHDPGKWSLILSEELGEVAKSALEGDRSNYLTELVQAAAVLVAWIECELRKES